MDIGPGDAVIYDNGKSSVLRIGAVYFVEKIAKDRGCKVCNTTHGGLVLVSPKGKRQPDGSFRLCAFRPYHGLEVERQQWAEKHPAKYPIKVWFA